MEFTKNGSLFPLTLEGVHFATNHYGKLPTPVLMSATGHTTEKMFLAYIGKSSIDNAEILRSYWNKLELIQDKKTVLKIAK